MLLADLRLARRIEAAEAQTTTDAAGTHARIYPGQGGHAEQIAGGCAAFLGAGSPLSHAVGMGLSGPLGEGDLERVESFYLSRGSDVEIVLCPLVEDSVLPLLDRRGYRVNEWENVLARRLDKTATLRATTRDIRHAGPQDADLWARTAAAGLAEEPETPPDLEKLFRLMVHVPSVACFLAYLDGEPAGSGTMSVQNEVASLFGASTLPRFRNRGIQTALLEARLTYAATQGCTLAVVAARPGSGSQRNAERQGFRVVYTRTAFLRRR